MKIVICDDDSSFIYSLKKEILVFYKMCQFSAPEISCFNSAEDMLRDKGIYDLAFLDVEMKGISGIAASVNLKEFNKNILVFIVTSFDTDYLDDAMEEGVYRYMMKPINPIQLHVNMRSALHRIKTFNKNIAIETPHGTLTVNTDDIVMIYTEGRKTFVKTIDQTYRSIQPFQYWEKNLPSFSFATSYKGVLLHLKYVKKINTYNVDLFFSNEPAYLSVRNRTSFKRKFLEYVNAMN